MDCRSCCHAHHPPSVSELHRTEPATGVFPPGSLRFCGGSEEVLRRFHPSLEHPLRFQRAVVSTALQNLLLPAVLDPEPGRVHFHSLGSGQEGVAPPVCCSALLSSCFFVVVFFRLCVCVCVRECVCVCLSACV